MMINKPDSKIYFLPAIVFLFSFLFLLPSLAISQKIGYQIKLKIDGFEKEELYLGYFYGDKQYLKDTAYVEPDGQFYFEGNEKLLRDNGQLLIVVWGFGIL